MSRRAAYADSAVFAYALGAPHPFKVSCVRLVEAATARRIDLHVSVETVQEVLFHRLRRTTRPAAVAEARNVAALCVLHGFDHAVLTRCLDLTERTSTIGGRDAVHAATALAHGLREIVSPDRAFDGIDGLRRLDPAILAAELSAGP